MKGFVSETSDKDDADVFSEGILGDEYEIVGVASDFESDSNHDYEIFIVAVGSQF